MHTLSSDPIFSVDWSAWFQACQTLYRTLKCLDGLTANLPVKNLHHGYGMRKVNVKVVSHVVY